MVSPICKVFPGWLTFTSVPSDTVVAKNRASCAAANWLVGTTSRDDNIGKPIEFNSNELELNPYLLGLILGDGGITQKGVSFTTEDVEIVNYIKPILPENSQITENKNSKYGKDWLSVFMTLL